MWPPGAILEKVLLELRSATTIHESNQSKENEIVSFYASTCSFIAKQRFSLFPNGIGRKVMKLESTVNFLANVTVSI